MTPGCLTTRPHQRRTCPAEEGAWQCLPGPCALLLKGHGIVAGADYTQYSSGLAYNCGLVGPTLRDASLLVAVRSSELPTNEVRAKAILSRTILGHFRTMRERRGR